MKSTNIEVIINILKYLHKLKDEISNDITFPPEIFIELINNMNYNSIKRTCNTSNSMKKLCQTKDVKDILINKFMKDSLDTSKFTKDQLEFYEKVKPLKRRMCLSRNVNGDKVLNIVYNKLLFALTLNKSLTSKESNINEISNREKIKYVENKNIFVDFNVILDNTGKVYINESEDELKDELIPILTEAISISKDQYTDQSFSIINIITSKKECYIWSAGSIFKIILPFNIIQRCNYFYLTDEGEVYMRHNVHTRVNNIVAVTGNDIHFKDGKLNNKYNLMHYYYKINGLPHIKQITSTGGVLSTSGDVYNINWTDLSVNKMVSHSNIIQICEDKQYKYCLDNKGNISNYFGGSGTFQNFITSQNIIEILIDNMTLYALDDKMKLYTYSSIGLNKTYNFLDL